MRHLLLIIVTITIVYESHAQYSVKDSLNSKKGDNVFIKPNAITLNTKNVLLFSLAVSTSFVLDKRSNIFILNNRSCFLDKYADISTYLGSKTIMAPLAIATWALAGYTDNDRLSTTAFNSVKSLFTGALLVESFKIISGRERPFVSGNSSNYHFFKGRKDSFRSLPSGHSFVSWAFFTPFAQEYGKWIYIIPASVSFSRMYKNKHWFSDVVIGAGIGYFAGLYFHNRKNTKIIFNSNGLVIRF